MVRTTTYEALELNFFLALLRSDSVHLNVAVSIGEVSQIAREYFPHLVIQISRTSLDEVKEQSRDRLDRSVRSQPVQKRVDNQSKRSKLRRTTQTS